MSLLWTSLAYRNIKKEGDITFTVRLWLRVEKNWRWVRGVKRARKDIEDLVLSRFDFEKPDKEGWSYLLLINCQNRDRLDDYMRHILLDCEGLAENRLCWIEEDWEILEAGKAKKIKETKSAISVPLDNMSTITKEGLRIFLEERPSLSEAGLEREAVLPKTKLKEFMKGNQKLSQDQEGRLFPILVKYGWDSQKGKKGLADILSSEHYNKLGKSFTNIKK